MRFIFTLIFTVFLSSLSFAQEVNYERVTYGALSSLMWKYKAHGTDNRKALDYYASIRHCDLYSKYFRDDFAWQRIREGIIREIEYYASDYPTRFEINAVVPIDRYDFEKSSLIISPDFTLDNAGAIQIPVVFDKNSRVCMSRDIAKFFPFNIKFSADNKFSLKKILVSSDNAQSLLKRISKYQYESLGDKRAITLKFQISINGIKRIDFNQAIPETIFKGQLDKIIFYEDPEMIKEIYSKSFKEFD